MSVKEKIIKKHLDDVIAFHLGQGPPPPKYPILRPDYADGPCCDECWGMYGWRWWHRQFEGHWPT